MITAFQILSLNFNNALLMIPKLKMLTTMLEIVTQLLDLEMTCLRSIKLLHLAS